jgi:hypothetical protein
MALIPRRQDSDREDPRRRIGQAGLDALMRDPRYWDGNRPDHDRVVDTVRRGFELVFALPKGRVPVTVPINPHATPPTDDDDPFARILSRLVARNDDLDALPEAERGALVRRAILTALKETGRRLPPGLDGEVDASPGARASVEDAREAAGDGNGPGVEDKDLPWHPVDENGNEILPHPGDPRFNPDGSPKKEWFGDSAAKRWAGRNSRYNPETGEFEYYADLPDFYRDLEDRGRWTRRKMPREDMVPPRKPPRVFIPDSPPPMPPSSPDPKKPPRRRDLARYVAEFATWLETQRRRKKGEDQ